MLVRHQLIVGKKTHGAIHRIWMSAKAASHRIMAIICMHTAVKMSEHTKRHSLYMLYHPRFTSNVSESNRYRLQYSIAYVAVGKIKVIVITYHVVKTATYLWLAQPKLERSSSFWVELTADRRITSIRLSASVGRSFGIRGFGLG